MNFRIIRIGISPKKYREENFFTVLAVAEKAGLTFPTILAIESGDFEGPIRQLFRFFDLADMEILYLKSEDHYPQLN